MPRHSIMPGLWRGPGVYILRHPDTQSVYVGSSSNVAVRYARHLRDLRHGIHQSKALQSLWGVAPSLAVEVAWQGGDTTDSAVLRQEEQRFIDYYAPRVLNVYAALEDPSIRRNVLSPLPGWEERLEALLPDVP